MSAEGWGPGMSLAYARGLADGKLVAGRPAGTGNVDPSPGLGFDACYLEGYSHGAGRCVCSEILAGKRDGRRCIVCGHRRHPLEVES